MTTVISVGFTLEQLVEIKQLVEATGRSRSAIIRDLVDTALEGDGELVTALRAELETRPEPEATTAPRSVRTTKTGVL